MACVGDAPVGDGGDPTVDDAGGATAEDAGGAGPDASQRPCSWNAPFPSPAERIDGLTPDAYEHDWPTLTDDELTMLFSCGKRDNKDLCQVTRSSRSKRFDFHAPLVVVRGGNGYAPFLADNGGALYYFREHDGGALMMAERASDGGVGPGTALSAQTDRGYPASLTETTKPIQLYGERYYGNGTKPKLYTSTWNGAELGLPMELTDLNDAGTRNEAAFITKDGRTLYFSSDRPGGEGRGNLWVAHRDDVTKAFDRPVWLEAPLNTSDDEVGGIWVSPDACRIYFARSQAGDEEERRHLFMADRSPT